MAKTEKLKPILEKETEKQVMRFYERENGSLVFALGELGDDKAYIQFVTGKDEEIYHKNLVNHAFHMNPKAKDILILGGGDGLVARNIRRKDRKCYITLLELDEELIEFFKDNVIMSELNEGSLHHCHIIIGDAKEKIKELGIYDIIINDLPDPTNKDFEKLYEEDFYREICKHLKDNGVIAIQSHFNRRKEIANKIDNILGNSTIKPFYLPYLEEAAVVLGVK